MDQTPMRQSYINWGNCMFLMQFKGNSLPYCVIQYNARLFKPLFISNSQYPNVEFTRQPYVTHTATPSILKQMAYPNLHRHIFCLIAIFTRFSSSRKGNVQWSPFFNAPMFSYRLAKLFGLVFQAGNKIVALYRGLLPIRRSDSAIPIKRISCHWGHAGYQRWPTN